jgi:ribosomal protein S18 acetylase RimI-like enzyme
MYLTQDLNALHNRTAFFSGNEMLDIYLKTQANQDINRKLSTCFVLADEENNSIIKGYYTLSNNSISLDLVPDNIQKKLPKSYKSIPTTLLGRLAVAMEYQGQGIGRILLVDALKRSYEISKIIGSFAVVVDPIDQAAEEFYKKYGFIKLPDSGKMFLTTKTIEQLFQ